MLRILRHGHRKSSSDPGLPNKLFNNGPLLTNTKLMHHGTNDLEPAAPAPLRMLALEVDDWIQRVGVRYFSPLTNMAMLSEEVGEVARILARRHGDQIEKESDKAKDLGQELADVLFVVLCLANQTGTDLQQAWDERMRHKSERDKDRFRSDTDR